MADSVENTVIPMTKRKKSQHCSACNCQNSRQFTPQVSFFRFPKDEERSKRWVLNCRREDLLRKTAQQLYTSNVLCEKHFEDNQFRRLDTKNRLIKSAVPTIFDISNPPKKLTPARPLPRKRCNSNTSPPSSSNEKKLKLISNPESHPEITNTDGSTCIASSVQHTSNANPFTPRKQKMKAKIFSLKKKALRRKALIDILRRREAQQKSMFDQEVSTVHQILSKHLSGPALNFIMNQVLCSKTSKYGRRWTQEQKRFALSLFHGSPSVYRMLKKVFCLPSVSTLKRCMSNVSIEAGFKTQLMDAFKAKVLKMTESERICSLVFDEMAIKESMEYNPKHDRIEGYEDFGTFRTKYVANHATVFMVRGIIQKWKQPFAYFFSSGTIQDKRLRSLIEEAISVLAATGLRVKALICDQGSNNRAALRSMGVSLERPYLERNGNKIHIIFDPPHLLKNIRNNFKKHGFEVGGPSGSKQIMWDHVKQFYKQDVKLPVRMAPKLTQPHLLMPPFANLNVRLAAQVLSHSVYAGMSTMVAFGALPFETQATANFIRQFDSLFNCFNSYKPTSKKPMNHAISATSAHQEFLHDAFTWISTIKSKSKVKRPPCLDGWQVAIASLLSLVADLTNDCGVKYVLTSGLNQGCVENLFSVIRGKGGHRDNPTTMQFKAALHQTMVDLMFTSSRNTNCQEDLDVFLVNLSNMPAHETPNDINTDKEVEDVDGNDDKLPPTSPALKVQNENVVAYIAGYVAKKLESKVCPACSSALLGSMDDTRADHQLIYNKLYSTDCLTGLQAPSDHLLDICLNLERHFRALRARIIHKVGVKKAFSSHLHRRLDHDQNCGKCNSLEQIINLFLNIRLHFSLKLDNRELKSVGVRNRKVLKLSHV